MNPIVSVVVPTYRRNELLVRCLSAVAAQRMPPEQFEVIVADDACSRETQRQVEEFASEYGTSIRYVAVGPAHGPAGPDHGE